MSSPPTRRSGPALPAETAPNTIHNDTDSLRQDLEIAWELGYETGYQHALILAAERADELDAIWQGVPRPTYEQKVAQRVAEMQRHSERLYAELGRPGYVYTGGPVDWDTGAVAS